MIPKIAHFYWGLGPMSFLQYMTVVSFNKHNPDYKINVYTPKERSFLYGWQNTECTQHIQYTGIDYFENLTKLSYINLEVVDFDKYEIKNDISEIHKSDYIRLIKLIEHGGIWSDFDILYIKPLNLSETADTILTFNGNYYLIGFFGSTKNNDFFKSLLDKALQTNITGYQSIGSPMIKELYPSFSDIIKTFPKLNVVNYPTTNLYAIEPHELHLLYNKEYIKAGEARVTDNVVGIHWFYGDEQSKQFCNNFDSNKLCLIQQYLRDN